MTTQELLTDDHYDTLDRLVTDRGEPLARLGSRIPGSRDINGRWGEDLVAAGFAYRTPSAGTLSKYAATEKGIELVLVRRKAQATKTEIREAKKKQVQALLQRSVDGLIAAIDELERGSLERADILAGQVTDALVAARGGS